MSVYKTLILSLILTSVLIQDVRSACEWDQISGQPGKAKSKKILQCRDEEDAYTAYNSYEAVCEENIDLDMKPCYVELYGVLVRDYYVYSLDIVLKNPQTNKLFTQNLNSYKGLQVRKLQIKEGHLNTVPKEIFDLNHLEILDLSLNDIQDIQITSFALIPGLDTLDLSFNKITDLNPIPVNVRSNATKVLLNHNRIQTFPVNFLYYFPNAEKLHLQDNMIDSVTLTDFEGAINLKYLDLSNNKLTTINGDGFRRLSHSLELLQVHLNRISNLPSKNDFTFLKLKILTAGDNQINVLGSFENFPKIFLIDVSNNKISQITRNVFERNKNLRMIAFDHNPIREIESNSFEKNTKLTNINLLNISLLTIEGLQFNGFNGEDQDNESIFIDLRNGKIISIADDAFIGVKGLKNLYLSSNAIEHISSLAFNTLDSLRSLDISRNQLKSFDFKTNNLKKLESFYAHHNKIEKVSKTVFENLISLVVLDLSYNNIKEIDPNALANMKSLSFVNFSNNKELDVMKNKPLSDLKNLNQFKLAETRTPIYENGSITHCNENDESTLNASFSKIKTIEYNAFVDSECLRTIVLSNNELESFHVNATSVKNLKELLLDNNHITNINSYTFNNFNNLERIHLQNNDIVYVDTKAFQNVPKLTFLYISTTVTPRPHFKVTGLSQELAILSVENFDFDMNFEDFINLYKLQLKSCGIKDLSKFDFSKFRKLEELNVTSNDLSVVNHETLKGLSTLYRLNLSNNKISSISVDSFSTLSRLLYLDLSENRISNLPNGVFAGQEKLIRLRLSSNLLNTFDVKVLPPTAELYLDNNPIARLDFDYVFSSNITKISVGHTITCGHLADVEMSSPVHFKKIVTADPLSSEVPNVEGIPCYIV